MPQPSLKCLFYKSQCIWASFTLKQWQPGVTTGLSDNLIYDEDLSLCISLLHTSRRRHHSLTQTLARRNGQNGHRSSACERTHTGLTEAESFKWVAVSLSCCLTGEEENKSAGCLLHPGPVIKKINPRWEIYKACPSSGCIWKLAAQGKTHRHRAIEGMTTATKSNGSNTGLIEPLSAGHSFVYNKKKDGSRVKCGWEESFFYH